MASSGRLAQGARGSITVSVDVRGKTGKITKAISVSTNDPVRPVTTLTVSMKVKDALHMKKYDSAEIFSVRCGGCHIDRGRGKRGPELFEADCGMCHNVNKSAASINDMRKMSSDDLGGAIRNGVKNTAMPAWDIKYGGPLSDEDVRSLIETIKR